MGLLNWLRKPHVPPDPEVDRLIAEMKEFGERRCAYFRENGVPTELHDDENPFAVLWPKREADESSLRRFALQLHSWIEANPEVRRVLGLERLLEGKRARVPAEYLMVPICPTRPETWTEGVALVVLAKEANEEALAASLGDLVERSGVIWLASVEQYSWMTR